MYPALIKEEKKVQSKQTHFGSVEAFSHSFHTWCYRLHRDAWSIECSVHLCLDACVFCATCLSNLLGEGGSIPLTPGFLHKAKLCS